jgi:hypothetical protein
MIEALGHLLSAGITGFGLGLAYLAYKLLSAEQRVQEPRLRMLVAIYVFMAFSGAFLSGGLGLEVYKLSIDPANRVAAVATPTTPQQTRATVPTVASGSIWDKIRSLF